MEAAAKRSRCRGGRRAVLSGETCSAAIHGLDRAAAGTHARALLEALDAERRVDGVAEFHVVEHPVLRQSRFEKPTQYFSDDRPRRARRVFIGQEVSGYSKTNSAKSHEGIGSQKNKEI